MKFTQALIANTDAIGILKIVPIFILSRETFVLRLQESVYNQVSEWVISFVKAALRK